MRTVSSPTATPVKIATGQRLAPNDSVVERFVAEVAMAREVGAET